MKKNIFLFSAIVDQEKIKKAFMLNAINPSIGGVLIKGDRGTGKTTDVRALADLLPKIEAVENCAFNCDENSLLNLSFIKLMVNLLLMIPEEGELRGQLSDRIGLEIEGISEIKERILIMKRREEFEKDQKSLQNKIIETMKQIE